LDQAPGRVANAAAKPEIDAEKVRGDDRAQIGNGASGSKDLDATGSLDQEWKRVAKNSTVEGRLLLPVFAGERVAIPAGTKLRLTIESVKKVSEHQGKWAKFGATMVRVLNPLRPLCAGRSAIHLSTVAPDAGALYVALQARTLPSPALPSAALDSCTASRLFFVPI